MKSFILCSTLLWSSLVFADNPGTVVVDAGIVVAAIDAGTVDVVLEAPDAGVPLEIPSLESPFTSAKGFYKAVKTGNGWLAAMFMLFFLVGFIRIVGKRIHAMIPDDTKNKFLIPVERVLFFIFDTKIGGWVLNWLSAIGGCLSAAAMAGSPVDAAAWKVAILASTGGTALIELKDDVMEWWDLQNAKKLAEREAAKATLAVVPPPPDAAPPESPKA
jgi:hypothetical protein